MTKKTIEDIKREDELLENAWLYDCGVDRTTDEIFNPLLNIPEDYIQTPHIYIVWLLSNPEYFSLFCKEVLNIQIHPIQAVVLKELWTKKFPMLIGTRAFGKCINGNSLVITNNGISKIGDMVGWNVKEKTKIFNLPSIQNENKAFNEVEYGWNNGFGKTIKIETSEGFILEGVPEHRIRIVRDGNFEWCELQNLRKTDYIPIDRSTEWFKNPTVLHTDFAYSLGLSQEQNIPSCILKANKESVREYIKGLMDKNGLVSSEDLRIQFYSESEEISRTLQFLLTRFGIISRVERDFNKNNFYLSILEENCQIFAKEIGFRLEEKQKLLECLCNKKSHINDEYKILPESHYFYDRIKSIESSYCQTFDVHCKDDHSFISNGFISHNTFLLALYAILRMVFIPGRKIVMTGAGFRQSKLIFSYMEKIWDNSPVLRDLAGPNSGYNHGTDAYEFKIGESITYALPIGDGCLTQDCLITTSNGISNIDLDNTSGVVNHDKYIWSSSDQKFVYSDESYNNGIQKTKKITTKRGYSIEGTLNHKLKVLRDDKVVWSRLDEMVIGDRILIDRSERWHNNTTEVTESQAYKLGLVCKEIPNLVLSSSKNVVASLISGLYDIDGSIIIRRKFRGASTYIKYKNISEKLVYTLQYLLLHFGIISSKSSRWIDGKNENRIYELYIFDDDVRKFHEKINFLLSEKKTLLENLLKQEKQAKGVDDDVYLDCIEVIEDGEACTYDVHIPETHEYCANGFFSHNTKIRGYRAHDIIVDEFAVGNPDILEHVIFGFAAVSADPIGNVKGKARRKLAKLLKREIEENGETYKANQIILSGTAYYEFNHSYRYWRKYQNIVRSRGDKRRLQECGADPNNTNHKDYTIIRIPYYMMPDGFMETDIIIRSKNNMHESLFNMEFNACFSNDSNGFFKRVLLEKCVSNHDIVLYGDRNKEYVLGIDPASESDNFCIVVLEVSKNIRKVVYCWTSTKQGYKDELKSGKAKENDFYDYVCRKILSLVNNFNVIGIAIDSQGGGHAIVGRLHNPSIINKEDGEVPLWPIINVDKPTEDDTEFGRHIIELISFADAKWTSESNHGMRLDFESRTLLFPQFDGLTFAEIDLSSENETNQIDVTEESILEIEEMKNELSSIVMSETPSGRDKWDTPDQKLPGSKKGRLRKDRYSSLLMANYLGKKVTTEKREMIYNCEGGIAKSMKDEVNGPAFTGTDAKGMALAAQLNDLYS